MKPFAPSVDQHVNLVEFVRFEMFTVDIFLRDIFRLVEQMPTANDVFGICFVAAIAVNVEYNMIVV